MHFKWNYEAPTPEQEKAAKELGDKLSISPILGPASHPSRHYDRIGSQTVLPSTALRPHQSIPDEGHGYCRRPPQRCNGKQGTHPGLRRLRRRRMHRCCPGVQVLAAILFQHRLLHPRPLRRGLWSKQERNRLCTSKLV